VRSVCRVSVVVPPIRSGKGFALIAALVLMAFFVMLVLGLATFAQIHAQLAAARLKSTIARQNALLALDLALAELHEAAGPDQRITATARLTEDSGQGTFHWTGVWNFTQTSQGTTRWLISGDTAPGEFAAPDDTERLIGNDSIWLVWKHAVTRPEDYVAVPLVSLRNPDATGREKIVGRYAYWVGDEGVKASILAVDVVDEIASGLEAQQLRQRGNPAHDLSLLLPDFEVDDSTREALARVLSPFQIPAVLSAEAQTAWRRHRHDITALAPGLLVNTDPVLGGGIRLALDDAIGGIDDERFADVFADGSALRVWRQFPPLDAEGRLPLHPIAAADYDALPDGAPYVSITPILSEAIVRLTVFDLRVRREPAIRFNIECEFFNPYTRPILLSDPDAADRRALSVAVRGLPLLEVENVTTGQSTGVVPIDAMAGSGSTREVASWMEFDEVPGGSYSGEAVLRAGETYRLQDPDPVVQPTGLVRYTGTALAVDNAHEIIARMDPPLGNNGVRFGMHRGRDATGEIIWEIQNVPYVGSFYRFYPPLDSDVKPYIIPSTQVRVDDMFTFAFHFGLGFGRDWTNDGDLGAWRDSVDLRRPVIDYAGSWIDLGGNSRPNAEFIRVAGRNPVEAETNLADVFPGTDWLYDNFARDSTRGSYGDVRLYDVPQGDPVGVADFRHLPFKNRPPHVTGSRWGGELNTAFDRYFFSAVPLGGSDESLPRSRQPRLRIVPLEKDSAGNVPLLPTASELRGKDAAQHFRLQGAFNWNSTSVEAWRIVLSQAFEGGRGWQFRENGGSGSVTIERTIFRHNFGAAEGGEPANDALLATAGPPHLDQRDRYFRQGVRLVGADRIRALAEAIVNHLCARGRPFPSLAAFLDSGLFEDAIATSGLNSGYPRHANGFVSQSDLVAMLAPGASVRSDTFIIRTYGDVLNPVTASVEGRAALEALVCRTITFVDPKLSPAALSQGPRRFEIVAFRWLDINSDL